MKKLVLLFTALFGFIAGVSAQEKNSNEVCPWTFQVRSGINYSSFKKSDGDSHIGFTTELLADYHLKNNLYLRTGLEFNEFRSKSTINTFYYNGKVKTIANSFYLPLRLAWKLPISKNFKLDLETGTYFSYCIGGKTNFYEQNAPEYESSYKSKFNDRYNFGFQCGVGIMFKKYYIGFSTMTDYRNLYGHNRFTGALKLGYTF